MVKFTSPSASSEKLNKQNYVKNERPSLKRKAKRGITNMMMKNGASNNNNEPKLKKVKRNKNTTTNNNNNNNKPL